MQLNIRVEKIDIYEGIIVKVLLDSGTIRMFMDWKIAVRYRFRLQKLKRPIVVKNVDGMNNSVRAIIYQVKVDMYYKSHIERMRMDVYNLRRINIILEMLWFQMYNLETN